MFWRCAEPEQAQCRCAGIVQSLSRHSEDVLVLCRAWAGAVKVSWHCAEPEQAQ